MDSPQPSPLLAALSCVVLLSGCFIRGSGGIVVSSVKSDYSPVVSFTANVRISDSLRVQVDRVRVLSPGEIFEGMGAVTS